MKEIQPAPEGNHEGLALGTAGDFLRMAAYSGLSKPAEGLSQIGHAISFGLIPEASFHKPDGANTILGMAGGLSGSVADFIGLQRGIGSRFAAAGAADTVGNAFLRDGLSGASYAALMPTSEQGNFWLNKGRDLGVGFGTFGTMGASARWLGGTAFFNDFGRHTLVKDVLVNGTAGMLGGTANAELHSLAYGNGPASAAAVADDALSYGAFGAFMAGGNHLLDGAGRAWDAHGFHFNRASDAAPVSAAMSDPEASGLILPPGVVSARTSGAQDRVPLLEAVPGAHLGRTVSVDGDREAVTLGTRRPDQMPLDPAEKISPQAEYIVKFPREQAQIGLQDGHVRLALSASAETPHAYDMAWATEFTRLALTDSRAAEAARSVVHMSSGFKSQPLISDYLPDGKAVDQAARGAVDYVKGVQTDNPYTAYLKQRFGQWPSVRAFDELTIPQLDKIAFLPDETPWKREWTATHISYPNRTAETNGLSGLMRTYSGFDDVETAEPRRRLLAYHYAFVDPGDQALNLYALGTASHFHSMDSIAADPTIVPTYASMLGNGWRPEQATKDGSGYTQYMRYVAGQEVHANLNEPPERPLDIIHARKYEPPMEYYAARALAEAQARFSPAGDVPVAPTPETLKQVLDDPGFRRSSPPQITSDLYRDLAIAHLKRAQNAGAADGAAEQLDLFSGN